MYEDTQFQEKLEDLYRLKFRQFLTSKSTGHRSPMSKVLARYHKYQIGQLKLRRKKAVRKRPNSVAPTKPSGSKSTNAVAVHESAKAVGSNKTRNAVRPNNNTDSTTATRLTKTRRPNKTRNAVRPDTNTDSTTTTRLTKATRLTKTLRPNKTRNAVRPDTNTDSATATRLTKALTATAKEATKINANEKYGEYGDEGGMCRRVLRGFVGCFAGCFRRGRD